MKTSTKLVLKNAGNAMYTSGHPDKNRNKPVKTYRFAGFFISSTKVSTILKALHIIICGVLFLCSCSEREVIAPSYIEELPSCINAPTDLSASSTNHGIQLRWNNNCSFKSVLINKKSPDLPYYYLIIYNSSSSNTFVDADVREGETYFYQVATSNLIDGFERNKFTPVLSITY